MIYLASPYHDSDPAVRAERLRLAEEAMHYIFQGDNVFSPIAHNAPSSERLGSHRASNYIRFDFDFLFHGATKLYILAIPGWNRSRGVLMEIGFSICRQYPVCLVRPDPLGQFSVQEIDHAALVDLIYSEEE